MAAANKSIKVDMDSSLDNCEYGNRGQHVANMLAYNDMVSYKLAYPKDINGNDIRKTVENLCAHGKHDYSKRYASEVNLKSKFLIASARNHSTIIYAELLIHDTLK